ncbi:hypothetical protein CBR_g49812 [Chara braunii]|uniref:Reverse transcriptase domain-containing protein n=1 Tax=Chara braunii TaxID=69332 RepID=A0A388JPB8_CHABU|nr:hypothetical protein CBR_g49812 [Chara braunii]|eukprot:GBG59552.1 hypothetical protein CBR_g49812 [Chara braunii]
MGKTRARDRTLGTASATAKGENRFICRDSLAGWEAYRDTQRVDPVNGKEQPPPAAGATTAAAPDASFFNNSDRLNSLEIDIGTLKDDAQLQQTATQQLEQQICVVAATPNSAPRETTPKFDGQEIFCDSTKTDLISWFRKFELKLQLHHVSENQHHACLYSRLRGACQAWLDNLLSKYGVVAVDLYTKISWDGLKAAWHTRFQVEPPGIKAMDKLMTFEHGMLPSVDWVAEYQRLTSIPDIQMGFKAVKHYFISRSCPALGNASTHVKDTLTTTVELFDKAAQIIISIRPNDRYKSAFKTRHGHFEWVVMPFGLTNAQATFQTAMTNEFRAMLDRFVLVYLDDILVYSQTLEDRLEHLRRVLETLRHAKYKANRNKREFVQQELEYLGHFVTREGINLLFDKIQAIQEWPEPRNIMDVRSFLGLAGYYQRFIKGYSKIAAHLTKLQCEDRPFDFGENAGELFLALKATPLSAEVLHIYDPLLPTRFTMDVSGYGIGEQHDGVDWHPVEYFSKKVSVVHSIDDARKKELLAFVHSLKRWWHFLLGRSQFRWVTDNNPLVFYKTQDTVNSTITHWMTFIDQFDFFPDHIPGKSNRFADGLSRRPDHCTAVYSTFEIDHDLRDSFIRGYQVDPKFHDKYANCSSPNLAPSLVHTRGTDLLCVPSDSHLCTRLLGEFHDAPATRHFGVNRTIGRPGLLGDVTRYRESCEVCRRCTSRNHLLYGKLRPLPVPLRRSEVIAMDITGPFPKHKTGVDGFSRWSTNSPSAPCFCLAAIMPRHRSWPRFFMSVGFEPRVTPRTSSATATLGSCSIFGWRSARHPQTDGQTERAHQTAQVLLRTLIRPDQKDWVEWLPDVELPDVELAYNSSIDPAIGMSPFKFEHDSLVTSSLDTIIPRMVESDDHLLFLRRMQELLVKARDQMAKTQQRMSQQANRQRLPCPLRASDLVWVSAAEFSLEQAPPEMDGALADTFQWVSWEMLYGYLKKESPPVVSFLHYPDAV